MLVHTREQWREAVASLSPSSPILVHLTPTDEPPWSLSARLRMISVCFSLGPDAWRTLHVPLAQEGEPNADPRTLGALIETLLAHPLFVEDAYTFTLHMACRFGRFFPVHTDAVLASRLLAEVHPNPAQRITTVADREHLTRQLVEQYEAIADLREGVGEVGLRVAYEVEQHALQVLAASAAQGYLYENGDRHYPTWTTTRESASSIITAAKPPLTSLPISERLHYPADPYCRWVEVRWPHEHFQVGVLAARAGSPWLWKAACADAPFEVLGDLWGCSPREAADTFLTLTMTGPSEYDFVLKTGGSADRLRQLARVAPEWVQWGVMLHDAAQTQGYIRSFLGRFVVVEAPRKACMFDVQTTQAMLLKMLLSRLHTTAAQQPDRFAAFHALIPVHSKVAYQIDVHVPVPEHAALAASCATLYPAADKPLRVEVYMGPSWGALTRVDGVNPVQAQAAMDLASPAHASVRCPICGGVADNVSTLKEHVKTEHGIDMMSYHEERA